MTFLMLLNSMWVLLRHSFWFIQSYLNVRSFALKIGDQTCSSGEIKRAPTLSFFQISHNIGYLSSGSLPMTKMRKVGTCTWDHTDGRTRSQNQVPLGAPWAPRLPWRGAGRSSLQGSSGRALSSRSYLKFFMQENYCHSTCQWAPTESGPLTTQSLGPTVPTRQSPPGNRVPA